MAWRSNSWPIPPSFRPKVMTGHDDGVVTIALAEADSAEIEKRRAELAEPYRSLLGHFRHEVGHHYWDILVRDGGKLEQCRAMFGDDLQDYEAALKRHYEQGAPSDWPERFVSAYATCHPWEDFAETWAHYLHIVDTLETANAFGLRIAPSVDKEGAHFAKLNFDPYAEGSIERIVEAWAPFVVAMNSVNRAMGRPDLYPFVIAPAVVDKLRFIHDLVRAMDGARGRRGRGSPRAAIPGAALTAQAGVGCNPLSARREANLPSADGQRPIRSPMTLASPSDKFRSPEAPV